MRLCVHRNKSGLHAVLAGTPVENQGNKLPKFNMDISSRCRADTPEAVGAGCCQWGTEAAQHLSKERMSSDPDGDTIRSRSHKIWQIWMLGQEKCQGTWPESRGKSPDQLALLIGSEERNLIQPSNFW